MSKNHPDDNIYSILGKLEALTPKAEPKTETPKTIYESVDSQGSILKGLRKVSTIETRLAEAFAKDKEDDHCKECDCSPCECPTNESTCNECGMFESKCSCEPTNEGEVTHPSKGVTRHTKTDFPGYPTDDTQDSEDERAKTGKRGRPLKAQTKNPRRDPNAPKLGRGRPKKDVAATYTSMNDPFGRVPSKAPKSKVKGTVHTMGEAMDSLTNKFVAELHEGRILDETGETIEHILNRFKAEVRNFEQGGDLDNDLYDALFDYYCDAGEMPYGVAKARTGDPYEWVANNLESHLNGGGIVGGNPDEDYGLERESIDPTNPRDYEIPAVQRQAQGQAPLSMKDVLDKDQKAAMDYQRRAGNVQEDPLAAELNELAKLAGLKTTEGNAFTGKLVSTAKGDKFDLDGKEYTDTSTLEEEPNEGNAFTGKLANTEKGDKFDLDGKEYTDNSDLDEDKIVVKDAPDAQNKPKPKYGTIKAITTQGDDLNRQKKQDPHTANKAANPLTNMPTLESQLAAEYESIKKSSK